MSKVVASYLVRVTLHESVDEVQMPTPTPPTNVALGDAIEKAISDSFDFTADEIGVESERTDK